MSSHETTAATRIRIARVVIDAMLTRASRVANVAETESGRISIIPIDSFRMNMLALAATLDGETRAEQLAVDDHGAAMIAGILHEAHGEMTITLSPEQVEKARELYASAARAGRHIEFMDTVNGIPMPLYRPVESAAVMLGEILSSIPRGKGQAPSAENRRRDAQ